MSRLSQTELDLDLVDRQCKALHTDHDPKEDIREHLEYIQSDGSWLWHESAIVHPDSVAEKSGSGMGETANIGEHLEESDSFLLPDYFDDGEFSLPSIHDAAKRENVSKNEKDVEIIARP